MPKRQNFHKESVTVPPPGVVRVLKTEPSDGLRAVGLAQENRDNGTYEGSRWLHRAAVSTSALHAERPGSRPMELQSTAYGHATLTRPDV